MKEISIGFLFVFFCVKISAQKVSNIRAEQRGQDIVVFYSLETTSPCEVSLILSQDDGATWGRTLKNVSGDVGKNISAGEKQIMWKVLEEREQLVGDNMKFKVIANGKKPFEPEIVFVEGGTFQMGSNYGEIDEQPVHSVTLSSYYMAKCEVTQSQWFAVMGENPSHFENCDQCPVESVSWLDVQIFIKKINILTGKKYRLPTEAEWEFAAKGGKDSKGYMYSGSKDINLVAWYSENSKSVTHVVKSKEPNEFGIYDMTGNVAEWCSDWFGYYNSNSEKNPAGIVSGSQHVLKGGCFGNSAAYCRTTARLRYFPTSRDTYNGFRLVLSAE